MIIVLNNLIICYGRCVRGNKISNTVYEIVLPLSYTTTYGVCFTRRGGWSGAVTNANMWCNCYTAWALGEFRYECDPTYVNGVDYITIGY